jgi:AbiV family abortive infection protein
MRNLHFIEAAAACLSNGERLIEDARWLPEDRPASAFALATIAQEEFAKAFLLFLASRNVIAWCSLIFRATRDHASKQLLGLVMNYLNPTWEDFERRIEDWRLQHEEWEKLIAKYREATDKKEKNATWNQLQELNESRRDLPGSVADAINILRYEKVGRWESSSWCWDKAPVYDAMAKSLVEGKLDSEKQDALYVRIGPKGGLTKTPNELKPEDAAKAMEMAGRFGSLVEGLLSGNNVNSIEYERIETAFRAIFASLAQEES